MHEEQQRAIRRQERALTYSWETEIHERTESTTSHLEL